MIPTATNVVENICYWDGNVNTWQPPANTLMLVQATTPAMVWVWNNNITPPDFVLTEVLGQGQIGFTWNGTVVTTNQPKPVIPTT